MRFVNETIEMSMNCSTMSRDAVRMSLVMSVTMKTRSSLIQRWAPCLFNRLFCVKLLTLKVIISCVCLLGSLKDFFKSFIRSFVIFSIYIFLFARVFVSFQRRFPTNEGEDLLSVFSIFLSFSLHIHKNKTVVVGSCARSYLLWWWWRWQRLRQCGRWIWWCYDAVWTQRVRFRTVGRQIGAACRCRWTK